MNNVSSSINEVYYAFCKTKNNAYDNQQNRIDENRKNIDIIVNKLSPSLSWDNIIKVASFPNDKIKLIVNSLSSGVLLSASVGKEVYYTDSDKIMPATLSISISSYNGEMQNLKFSDNVCNPLLSLKVPLSQDKDGMIIGNLTSYKKFAETVSMISKNKNPVIGYLQKDGDGTFAESVHLSEVKSFILPSGEKYSKAKFYEYIAIDKNAFENSIAANMLMHGLVKNSEAKMIGAVQQVSDLYQVGIAENNHDMQDAMKCIMKAFSVGYEKDYDTYIFPSTSEIMDAFTHNGIDGPYNIKIGQNKESLTIDNSYCIDLEANDITLSDFNEEPEYDCVAI